ncbi:MAG: hypothetical protein R2809_00595 [Flavobacteriales bacterium]
MTNVKFLLFLFLSASITTALAQDLEEVETNIELLMNKLANSKNDENSDTISTNIRNAFIEAFNNPEVFNYSFDRLKMCKIKSSDGKVRLFNWNQPNQDGTFKYYCFVLKKDSEKAPLEWFELTQAKREVDKIENKILNADRWIGTLYYDIIPIQISKNKTQYVVLGWEGKDDLTTRKIIDVIDFSGTKVKLGANLFKSELGSRKRVIFEYSNDVSMSVKYYAKKKCIVVDHLSPKNPMMEGIYADYGPDGTYSMYKLEKDKFEFIDNIDISQFVEDSEIPYKDPRPRRRR